MNRRLRGRRLVSLFPVETRAPARLRRLHAQVGLDPRALAQLPPTVALASVGQARADGLIRPAREAAAIDELLKTLASQRPIEVPDDSN